MSNNIENSPLADKVALITGAGQGIGQGIAFSLAKRGVKVVAVGRTLSKCENTVAQISERFCAEATAAPQVGIHQQLLVIDLDLENAATPPLVLINPEITAASAGLDTYEEGCLSIPGVYLDVVRPTAIELSFRDEMGRPRKMKADGLMARCIQHEMDHLNGVLFVDRVTDEDGLQKELKEKGFERQDVRSVA